MRLERLKVIVSLEDLEDVEGLERLEPLKSCYSASGCFFRILAKQKQKTQKQDWKKTYVFLVTERSDLYLSWRPINLNLIIYITMSIIVKNLEYINIYCQVKYGLLIKKSLSATR